MIRSRQWVAGFVASLVAAGSALAVGPRFLDKGVEEALPGGAGRLPAIAADKKNQPHIACDGGTFCYLYDKVGGTWLSSAINVAAFGSVQYYNPHLEIDGNDTAWCSGILFGGGLNRCGIGVIVRTTMSTAPSIGAMSRRRIIPGSWDTGNLSVDVGLNQTVVWVSRGFWESYVYDPAGDGCARPVASGVMYCGVGGEINRIYISKAAPLYHADTKTSHAVWHVVTEAHAGYGMSYYKNSILHAAGQPSVAWANPNVYGGMGTDHNYAGVCADNKDPLVAYIACDLNGDHGMGGIWGNVYTGTAMAKGPDAILSIDRYGETGLARFEPDMAPAKDGGAFIIWSRGNRIKIRYLSPLGEMGDEEDICVGTRGAICTDSEGNLHIAYATASGMKYRKIRVSGSSRGMPHSGDFDADGKDDLALRDDDSRWYARSTTLPAAHVLAGFNWGLENEAMQPLLGNYKGNADGPDEIAVYLRSTGHWYIRPFDPTKPPVLWGAQWGGSRCVPVAGDYNGDGVEDLAVYEAHTGYWFIRKVSGKLIAFGIQWGGPGSVPVAGDYNGDGTNDLAVYQAATGNWFIRTLGGKLLFVGNWGSANCTAVAGDYNGDGRADLAVWERTTGHWFVRTLGGKVLLSQNWGTPTMVPVPGDFDGNGLSDLALYEPATGNWFIRTVGGTVLAFNMRWGTGTTAPLMGDVNGDGLGELAAYENGQWFLRSCAAACRPSIPFAERWWGKAGMVHLAGNFNGAGPDERAAYDSSTGKWYIRETDGTILLNGAVLGGPGWVPLVGDFNGDGREDLIVYETDKGNWKMRTLGNPAVTTMTNWGLPGFVPLVGDFFRLDGECDFALYDPVQSKWYIRTRDGAQSATGIQWGGPGCIPLAGDYAGDAATDLVIYNPQTCYWHVLTVGPRVGTHVQWGAPGMLPLVGDFGDTAKDDPALYDPTTGQWFIRTMGGEPIAWRTQWGGAADLKLLGQ